MFIWAMVSALHFGVGLGTFQLLKDFEPLRNQEHLLFRRQENPLKRCKEMSRTEGSMKRVRTMQLLLRNGQLVRRTAQTRIQDTATTQVQENEIIR